MDGAAEDADLLFLLTTNRADLLEPALAARPGRVDVAVEIGLPDADARRRLLAVHGKGLDLDLSEQDLALAVERTDGVTASFLKELLRRALLEALQGTSVDAASTAPRVTGQHLAAALDDLLDSTQGVTRALLGVPGEQSEVPLSPPIRYGRGHAHFGGGYESHAMVMFDPD
jgi:ATP-dependent 26S proteasome regulatory subunit